MDDSKSISRRRFLSGAASAAAVSVGSALAGSATPAEAQFDHIAATQELKEPTVSVSRPEYSLLIHATKGSIVSFASTLGEGRELLAAKSRDLPLLKFELMDAHRQFHTVTSAEAKTVHVEKSDKSGEEIITVDFKFLGGLPVHAQATIRCPAEGGLTYWRLAMNNGTSSWIGHVQFPVIQVPFDNLAKGERSFFLSSASDGALSSPVTRDTTAGTWNSRERNTPEVWRQNNYPGQWVSTQLMAHYNDAGGLYVACDDAAGLPKYLGPLMEEDAVTMAVGHYPGTRGPGEVAIPYNVVLGVFQGDWYHAAEIYRDWASKQKFCAHKLADRKEMAGWMGESPVGLAFPMRGQCDWDGPAKVNEEFTPATNALPALDRLAAGLDSSLIPIVFNWEHGGPWVQPEAFPPLGGEATMREFMAQAKSRGWQPMIYGDGLSWVIRQNNTGYDGMPYFRTHGGAAAVTQKWDGKFYEDDFSGWRLNYVACVGTQGGRDMVLGMTRGMAALGPAIVQQFDQGPGPRACYALDHGHPPVPGPWMAEAFRSLVEKDNETARQGDAKRAMSCEGAPPETYLQEFETWDARVTRCPLYSFLFHEYANGIEGFYTNRVSDEALRLSVARALVTGYMFSFTLRDGGRIEYDWDQTWTRAVPDQAGIMDWIKRANGLRRGVAKDYLIYGRMLRPAKVTGATHRDLGWGVETLVPSATWQAQDGRVGIVLANAADLGQGVRVSLPWQGSRRVKLLLDETSEEKHMELPGELRLELAPRSLCLIELA